MLTVTAPVVPDIRHARARALCVAGGALAVLLADHLSIKILAVAAGAFVYLGYHAIDNRSSLIPALTGTAGAAILRAVVPGI